MSQGGGSQTRVRIDKWLWHARLCKTRALAAQLVAAGHTRVNGMRTDKPGRSIGAGDILTVALGGQVRLLQVLQIGTRRGCASEASLLYTDITTSRVSSDQRLD
jgi:ribosome-associated heat shock protein Hsp15